MQNTMHMTFCQNIAHYLELSLSKLLLQDEMSHINVCFVKLHY